MFQSPKQGSNFVAKFLNFRRERKEVERERDIYIYIDSECLVKAQIPNVKIQRPGKRNSIPPVCPTPARLHHAKSSFFVWRFRNPISFLVPPRAPCHQEKVFVVRCPVKCLYTLADQMDFLSTFSGTMFLADNLPEALRSH